MSDPATPWQRHRLHHMADMPEHTAEQATALHTLADSHPLESVTAGTVMVRTLLTALGLWQDGDTIGPADFYTPPTPKGTAPGPPGQQYRLF